jgi:anti-sigma factor RsiW
MNADDAHKVMALVREHATRYRASPALREAIAQRLADEAHRPQATSRAPERPRRLALPRSWVAAIGFACGALLAAAALLLAGGVAPGGAALDTELVAGHVRSLMASHLVDVASSDRHTVKPWFQGRLDYAPPVEDPAAAEFPLVGGRLDVIAGRPVAALVYKRRGHTINLFVWPDAGRTALQQHERQGYHVLRWKDGAMQYALVSDLNAQELRAFAQLLLREP